MRYPTIHGFLKWAPTAIGGAAFGAAAIWAEVKDWIATQAVWGWHQMSDPLIAATVIALLCAYIWAVIWTSQTSKDKPAKSPLGTTLVGEGLDHVRVEYGSGPGSSYKTRFFPVEEPRSPRLIVLIVEIFRNLFHRYFPAQIQPEAFLRMEVHRASPATDAPEQAVLKAPLASDPPPAALEPSPNAAFHHAREELMGNIEQIAERMRDPLDLKPDEFLARAAVSSPPPETWIPLDEAVRYLAKGSQWGAEQDQNAPNFSIKLSTLLRDALACGDLTARGRKFHTLHGGVKDPPLHSLTQIPKDFWSSVYIDACWALHGQKQNIASRMVESVVRSGDHEGLHDIQLSKRQVERLWRRSDQSLYSEAWKEDVKDRIPYVRIRDIAHEYRLSLAHPDPNASNVAYGIEGELRQAAVDGKLKVWGRKQRRVPSNEPLVQIPASHFEDYEFGHGCLHYECENKHSHTGKMGKRVEDFPDEAYFDLYLSFNDTRAVLKAFAEKEQ